jgi:hypothetical protein
MRLEIGFIDLLKKAVEKDSWERCDNLMMV